MLTNMDVQSHMNSRPKFQPMRVKELLHFCESDDDESEDKPQDSDTDSDSDEPQPLPPDDCIEDGLNKSFPLSNEHTVVSSKDKESAIINNVIEIKTNNVVPEHVSVHSNYNVAEEYDKKSGSSKQDDKSWSSNFEISNNKKREVSVSKSSVFRSEQEDNTKSEQNVNSEQLNPIQLGCENVYKHNVNVDIKGQSNEEQAYKNDLILDQHNSCKISNNGESESIAFVSQISQSGASHLHNANTNIKVETQESKSVVNEEKMHHESISSTNKSLTSDTGTLMNSVEQLILQTPLKHHSVSSTRPDPCFSRRNINRTPQTKLQSEIPKNQGLTPATITSHWSQSNVKQTPLQNKSINFRDSIQTPKNPAYFTPSMARHETPRYLNTENKVRQPLADTGAFVLNDVSNRRLLQGSQLSKINEVIPKVQNNLFSRPSISKQIFEASESAGHLESDINEQLKENKYPNVEEALDKETVGQSKLSDSKHVAHCNKNSKENLKSSCGNAQNQYSVAGQNQQQDMQKIVDSASNVQFSMPSNIPKSKQSKTVFVKGKEYLILGTLGQGMSGEVLRVQDLSSLELCAIKCVNLNRMDKDSAQGCLEEISMLHKLQAPCVVKMFDYEIKYPMVYVVMEMGDTDLSRLLKTMSQEKQIPHTMVLYYWTEMLTAVKHIHDNGVIHSDLKPANFLLVRGRLKLIDFGIASSMNADMTSVVKNCPIGTLNYISPEALMDIGGNSDSPTQSVKYKITFKSDVWSLGCILYSLVYGYTPFHHIRSQWAKVNAITNPKPNIAFPAILPSADGDNKFIPPPPILIDVMRKCLQHEPKARPTVAELLQIQYVPTKPEHVTAPTPDIPANILVKVKHALSEDEWRQLIRILENRRNT